MTVQSINFKAEAAMISSTILVTRYLHNTAQIRQLSFTNSVDCDCGDGQFTYDTINSSDITLNLVAAL
jgi:hypothetical protein